MKEVAQSRLALLAVLVDSSEELVHTFWTEFLHPPQRIELLTVLIAPDCISSALLTSVTSCLATCLRDDPLFPSFWKSAVEGLTARLFALVRLPSTRGALNAKSTRTTVEVEGVIKALSLLLRELTGSSVVGVPLCDDLLLEKCERDDVHDGRCEQDDTQQKSFERDDIHDGRCEWDDIHDEDSVCSNSSEQEWMQDDAPQADSKQDDTHPFPFLGCHPPPTQAGAAALRTFGLSLQEEAVSTLSSLSRELREGGENVLHRISLCVQLAALGLALAADEAANGSLFAAFALLLGQLEQVAGDVGDVWSSVLKLLLATPIAMRSAARALVLRFQSCRESILRSSELLLGESWEKQAVLSELEASCLASDHLLCLLLHPATTDLLEGGSGGREEFHREGGEFQSGTGEFQSRNGEFQSGTGEFRHSDEEFQSGSGLLGNVVQNGGAVVQRMPFRHLLRRALVQFACTARQAPLLEELLRGPPGDGSAFSLVFESSSHSPHSLAFLEAPQRIAAEVVLPLLRQSLEPSLLSTLRRVLPRIFPRVPRGDQMHLLLFLERSSYLHGCDAVRAEAAAALREVTRVRENAALVQSFSISLVKKEWSKHHSAASLFSLCSTLASPLPALLPYALSLLLLGACGSLTHAELFAGALEVGAVLL